MAKSSRRASRIRAKQRRRAEHERAGNRRRFLRRLTIVGVGAAALLLVSGVAWEWASWFGSSAVSAFEQTALEEARSLDLRTIPRQSKEDLLEKWEALRELRRDIEENTTRVMRLYPSVPALEVGTSAAEIAAARHAAVESRRRMAYDPASATNPALRRYLEKVRRRAGSRR